MKCRLLFLLCLGFYSVVFSQYMSGVITYNNGSKKKGYLQHPQEISRKNTIMFKADLEKSTKKEKINLDDVKKLTYLMDDGESMDFVSIPYKKRNIEAYKHYLGKSKVKVYAQLEETDVNSFATGSGMSRMTITNPATSSTIYYF